MPSFYQKHERMRSENASLRHENARLRDHVTWVNAITSGDPDAMTPAAIKGIFILVSERTEAFVAETGMHSTRKEESA